MVKHSGFASCEGLLPVSKRLKVSPAIRYNRLNQGLFLLSVVQQNDFCMRCFSLRLFRENFSHKRTDRRYNRDYRMSREG